MRNTIGCLTQENCTKWLSTALELGTSVGDVHKQSYFVKPTLNQHRNKMLSTFDDYKLLLEEDE